MQTKGQEPKYFPKERSRSERPDIVDFSRFIADVGMTFTVIGDCYSYRPTMMKDITEKYPNVPIIHIVRHPFVWHKFHVTWRSRNMRMLEVRINL